MLQSQINSLYVHILKKGNSQSNYKMKLDEPPKKKDIKDKYILCKLITKSFQNMSIYVCADDKINFTH